MGEICGRKSFIVPADFKSKLIYDFFIKDSGKVPQAKYLRYW